MERRAIIITLSVVTLFLLYLTGTLYWGEKVFPLAPEIDTEYAPGYSDEKFARIKPGMTEQEVISALGKPFYVDTLVESWHEKNIFYAMAYSNDGACWFADFAWMIRDIDLDSNRRVVRVIKSIGYD